MKAYPGDVQALRGVSVEIANGEQVAVVGPSGSGKTTMLTIMGTLERATAGRVIVADLDIAAVSERQLAGLRAHDIGFVFQAFHLQEAMRAVDNVALGMLYAGLGLRVITHDQSIAAGFARRVEMRDGEIVADELQ